MGCLSEETIAALTENKLPPGQQHAARQHIAGCDLCRQLFLIATPDATSGEPNDEPAPMPALMSDQQIGEYRLIRVLGRGATGVVYEAHHQSIHSRVAIKVFSQALFGEIEHVRRALGEARAANQVQHPGLVRVFEIGTIDNGVPYLIMEYLDGEPMSVRMRGLKGPDRAALVDLLVQAAEILAVLHERGVVHRDLKPANLMIVADPLVPGGERVKLLDFGLAKILGGADYESLTQRGVPFGTPLYMSPEQCQGSEQVGDRADVYALGVMLYDLCVGRPPFSAPSLAELMAMHLRDPAPVLPRGVKLAPLVAQMLAKDPRDRPPMAVVARELAAARPFHLWGRRTASRAIGGTLLLIGLLVGYRAMMVQRHGCSLWSTWLSPRNVPVESLSRTRQIYLGGGRFTMGSTSDQIRTAHTQCQHLLGQDCAESLFSREGPQREVTLRPFHIDATEVTYQDFAVWLNQLIEKGGLCISKEVVYQGKSALINIHPAIEPSFGLVVQNGGFAAIPGFAQRPVDQVSWHAADGYCKAVMRRLPTEAEWEFAARGRSGRTFPWGEETPRCADVVYARCAPDESECNTCSQEHRTGPARVGSSRMDRTDEGVSDLAGNVIEWVADSYLPNYPPCPPGGCIDPVVQASGSGVHRVLRGSGWQWSALSLRAASRTHFDGDQAPRNAGFRCAATVPVGEEDE